MFGYETYFVRGRDCQRNSRLAAIFGIKSHNLPVLPTIGHWAKTLVIYTFKIPMLLTGISTMVNFCWPIGTVFEFEAPSKRTFLSNRSRDYRDRLNIRRTTPLLIRYRQIGLFALGAHNRRSSRYAHATPLPLAQLLNL